MDKKTVCVQRWAFMMAVLNLGVLLRKSSVVMVISTLQLVPRIYQSTMHGQLPQDEVLTTLHLSGHYARSATTRRSPHHLTFIRSTMHGQLPHDEVLTNLHFSYHDSCAATRLIALVAHHASILAARTVAVLGNTASYKNISNSLISKC